jgi:hypothetical protein
VNYFASASLLQLLWDHLFIVGITLRFNLRLLWSRGTRSLLLLDTTDNVVNPYKHASSLDCRLERLCFDTVRVPDLKMDKYTCRSDMHTH